MPPWNYRSKLLHILLLPCVIAASLSLRNNVSTTLDPSAANKTNGCKYNFTVYVYPTPPLLSSLRIAEEARANLSLHVCRKCILEQFSLEYIIYDFFTQFCGRTYEPSTADFFYLPIIRDAELRWMMQGGSYRDRPPSSAEGALLMLLEKNDSSKFIDYFQVPDTFWRRRNGADHIIVMPAPVTNLRHERNARGFFHYMLHLHSPIFVAVEYSLSFVKEYPVCATRKNILLPYPTIDPELFSNQWQNPPIEQNRSALLFYAGGMHGDCMLVRTALRDLMRNCSRLPGVLPKMKLNIDKREAAFLKSTFCPVPIGDSPSSKRMYDVLNFGCIPIVLSDDLIWAFSSQAGGRLDPSSFSIQVPQATVYITVDELLVRYKSSDFGRLPVSNILLYDLLNGTSTLFEESLSKGRYINPLLRILAQIPYEDILFYRRNIIKYASLCRFYRMNSMDHIPIAHHKLPDGETIEEFARLLTQRKREGTMNISASCREEVKLPGHKYVASYPCDRPIAAKNSKSKARSKPKKPAALVNEKESSSKPTSSIGIQAAGKAARYRRRILSRQSSLRQN